MDTSKFKSIFVQEANEHLSGIEKRLLEIDGGGRDPAIVDALFRHYHSLKGMGATMGYAVIQRLAHAQEDLLEPLREEGRTPAGPLVDRLFRALDVMKDMVRRVEEERPLPPGTEIEPLLRALAGGEEPAPAGPQGDGRGAQVALSRTMKVDVSVFDELLEATGELYTFLAPLKAMAQESGSLWTRELLHRLGKVADRLHESILEARMLPVGDLADKLPRVARDAAAGTGKDVAVEIRGGHIKMDRAVLAEIADPLVHITRNAVRHGIEPPQARRAAGKSPRGVVTVRAFRKKDRVVVEVSDDGAGIDVEKVRERAVALGMDAGRVRAMDRREALRLICLPALSLADEVDEVSGRGVGMDVVKRTVEAVGGSLDIESVPGRGSRFTLELPRATTITRTLLVHIGGEPFLVPISRIEKVVELDVARAGGGAIEYDGGAVEIVDGARLFGLPARGEAASRAALVLLADCGPEGTKPLAVAVDDFGAETNALIKPLKPPLTGLRAISGVTVLGDGRPAYLVDVAALGTLAGGAEGPAQ
ncbi:MAG TPA: hypothetical protein ENJ37_02310 [Deltaproteobacteria bacterium]|nr:hypothetical protein [Deltaproteobacteria bacterium]